MRDKRITIRLENDLHGALEEEAKKRGQTVVSLVRGFILDGLFNYDALGEVLTQSQERIEEHLELIAAMIGANLHVALEQKTLKHARNAGESTEAYTARLRPIYTRNGKESFAKAKVVNNWVREELEGSKNNIKRKKSP